MDTIASAKVDIHQNQKNHQNMIHDICSIRLYSKKNITEVFMWGELKDIFKDEVGIFERDTWQKIYIYFEERVLLRILVCYS